jgi:hypothetical protein
MHKVIIKSAFARIKLAGEISLISSMANDKNSPKGWSAVLEYSEIKVLNLFLKTKDRILSIEILDFQWDWN